ncbi:hypothetical protein FD755_014514 [Muntiacus reevesi]|uniref:Adiponectin receptor protein 1 n=1 Tax=Muntiacus reevesi TaxID=9886 RepID=A0A5N3XMH1_MUNRE|nr:hypothetical protein FD755_014514 [Muntiacus reevesi]
MSHKGPLVAQGNGAPAGNRAADTVELAELGALVEKKGKWTISTPTKAEEEQCGPLQAHHAMEKKEEFVYEVREGCWTVIPYDALLDWLKDNGYRLHGHWPPMPSFRACFKSIFCVYMETGNIWILLLGFVLLLFLGILTTLRPNMNFMAPTSGVGGVWDVPPGSGALPQLLPALLHCYHSEKVSRTFSELDFAGITLLIMGSFGPCHSSSASIVCVLGISAIIVAQWDRFPTPKHRQTRAGVFLGFSLSGVVPAMQFTITEDFIKVHGGPDGWFFLMALMYITIAGLCAAHIPKRFFPGKFDICFQSHQIFHVLVVEAAFIHFCGVSNPQEFRYGLEGGCTDDSLL